MSVSSQVEILSIRSSGRLLESKKEWKVSPVSFGPKAETVREARYARSARARDRDAGGQRDDEVGDDAGIAAAVKDHTLAKAA